MPGATGIAIAFNRLVSATRNVQQSRQQNHFIDDMNEKLFKPRGLYCMIMSYQPHSKSSGEIFNINKAIETATSRDQQTGVTKTMGNMRAADGTTRGELEMPPSAELIYPDLDQEEEDEVKQGFWEGKKTLAADYFDRRAQAEFVSSTFPIPFTASAGANRKPTRTPKIPIPASRPASSRNLSPATAIPTTPPSTTASSAS